MEFEQAYFDAWRFLKMGPREVDVITHRELYIMLRANNEAVYDNYEHMAYGALMNRQAHHAKTLKFSDLFKRPIDVSEAKNRQKKLLEAQKHTEEWLGQFTLFIEELLNRCAVFPVGFMLTITKGGRKNGFKYARIIN